LMEAAQSVAARPARNGLLKHIEGRITFLLLAIAGICLPLLDDSYAGVIATRACIYWILIAGLNLVVGYAGQIAIGWVALLMLGPSTPAVLTAGTVTPEISPYAALAASAAIGAAAGVIVGLPA